jgi:hypothetical protein
MPDIEAKDAEPTRESRVSRDLDPNPMSSLVLMTGSSELPYLPKSFLKDGGENKEYPLVVAITHSGTSHDGTCAATLVDDQKKLTDQINGYLGKGATSPSSPLRMSITWGLPENSSTSRRRRIGCSGR